LKFYKKLLLEHLGITSLAYDVVLSAAFSRKQSADGLVYLQDMAQEEKQKILTPKLQETVLVDYIRAQFLKAECVDDIFENAGNIKEELRVMRDNGRPFEQRKAILQEFWIKYPQPEKFFNAFMAIK